MMRFPGEGGWGANKGLKARGHKYKSPLGDNHLNLVCITGGSRPAGAHQGTVPRHQLQRPVDPCRRGGDPGDGTFL